MSETYLIFLKDNRYPVEADTNLVHQRSHGSHQGVQYSPSCQKEYVCTYISLGFGADAKHRVHLSSCLLFNDRLEHTESIFPNTSC